MPINSKGSNPCPRPDIFESWTKDYFFFQVLGDVLVGELIIFSWNRLLGIYIGIRIQRLNQYCYTNYETQRIQFFPDLY